MKAKMFRNHEGEPCVDLEVQYPEEAVFLREMLTKAKADKHAITFGAMAGLLGLDALTVCVLPKAQT